MNNKFILTIVGFVAVLAFGFLLNNLTYSKTEINIQPVIKPTQPDLSEKEYISKDLDISITIPEGYEFEENVNTINLLTTDKKISIDNISTNHLNLSDYIESLEDKNKLVIEREYNTTIDSYPAVIGIIHQPISKGPSEKAYFIYADTYTVYIISTSSPELYDDLDKVAQSFRYIPD